MAHEAGLAGGPLDALTEQILAAAFQVHTRLGPGLLESAYEACLAYELDRRSFLVERQKELPVRYDGLLLDVGYRMDLLIDGRVIIEIKSVQSFAPVHLAQLMTCLKLSGLRAGLLLDFNVEQLRSGGIKRLLNG